MFKYIYRNICDVILLNNTLKCLFYRFRFELNYLSSSIMVYIAVIINNKNEDLNHWMIGQLFNNSVQHWHGKLVKWCNKVLASYQNNYYTNINNKRYKIKIKRWKLKD